MIQDTSLQAYNEIYADLGERQADVFQALKYLEYATNTMVADHLGIPINCVTGRCKELRDKGLVVESHKSWCAINKKSKAIYWKLNKPNL